MAENKTELARPFRSVFEALDTREQRKALKSAMRREGNRLKKAAAASLQSTGISQGKRQRLSKGLRVRVYPDRYGAGFMVTTKPYKGKGYHVNRQGKEKPVLMWAADGTKARYTKTKTRFFIRRKKGHFTGYMPRYAFMWKTEESMAGNIENSLFDEFQKNLDRRLAKKGLS